MSDLSGKPIVELLRELATAAPDRVAVTAEEGCVTRGELNAESDRWAGELVQLGVSAGDYVCLVLPDGLELVSVLLGVWKAGAVPVPLNDRLAVAELAALMDLIGPSAVVGGDGAVLGSWPHLASGHRPAPHPGVVLDRAVISPSWKAMASGGSTGQPKVIVSTAPATVTEDLTGNDTSTGENEISLITAPLSHNGPFYNLVRMLLLGGRAVLTGRFDPERLLATIERERATRVYLVPTMMSRIWKLPEEVRCSYDLSSLRTVIHMGAPCPVWLKREWIDWLGPDRLTELYSSTEGVVVFTATGREWLEHPGTVGLPRGGQVQIRSADGVPLPPGATGLIWVRRDPEPEYLLCFAVTGPGKGHRGISTFLVDYPNPGVSVGREFDTIGTGYLGRSCDYVYSDCVVPAENMLGAQGQGFGHMMEQLNRNRCVIGARLTGMAAWAQRKAVAYAKERSTFGKPLAERQAIQWMLAESEMDIEQLRLLVYKTAWLLDQGIDARKEVAMVKCLAPVVSTRVIDRAIQIHGGLGLVKETRLAQPTKRMTSPSQRPAPRSRCPPIGRELPQRSIESSLCQVTN